MVNTGRRRGPGVLRNPRPRAADVFEVESAEVRQGDAYRLDCAEWRAH